MSAILASGILVMALYRVHRHAPKPGGETKFLSRKGAAVAIVTLVVIVAIPLAFTSRQLTQSSLAQSDVQAVVEPWAKAAGWSIVNISPTPGGITVRATGPLPEPTTEGLRAEFDRHGLQKTTVHIELVPGEIVDLPAH